MRPRPYLAQWEDADAWAIGWADQEPEPSYYFEEEFILPEPVEEEALIEVRAWPEEPERPPPQDAPVPAHGDQWWEDPGDAQGVIVEYLAKTGGDFPAALARIEADRSVRPDDINLRDAEHALITHQAVATFGPLGAVMALVAVPAYTAAKWVAQSVPEPIGQWIDAFSPIRLRGPGVTPPSGREVRAGLWR